MFWIGWLVFGFTVAAYVFMRSPHDRNKWFLIPFYSAIVIAGPLLLLLCIVPTETCQRYATIVRDWLEKEATTPTSGTGPGGNKSNPTNMLGGPGA